MTPRKEMNNKTKKETIYTQVCESQEKEMKNGESLNCVSNNNECESQSKESEIMLWFRNFMEESDRRLIRERMERARLAKKVKKEMRMKNN